MMFFHFLDRVRGRVRGRQNWTATSQGLAGAHHLVSLFSCSSSPRPRPGAWVAAISQSIGAGLYKRVQRYVGMSLEMARGLRPAHRASGPWPAKGPAPGPVAGAAPRSRASPGIFWKSTSWTLLPYYLLLTANAVFPGAQGGHGPRCGVMMLVMAVKHRGPTSAWAWDCGACPDLGYRGPGLGPRFFFRARGRGPVAWPCSGARDSSAGPRFRPCAGFRPASGLPVSRWAWPRGHDADPVAVRAIWCSSPSWPPCPRTASRPWPE